jgi:hypothetical protein
MKGSKLTLTLASAFAAVMLSVPAVFAHETPVNAKGTLIDVMCGSGVKSQADADAHTRECGLMDHCAASGYGIVIDGKFHKLDAEGSKQAAAIFKSSTKKDHITATVEGTVLDDGTLQVKTLKAD